jgi:hypothetical protein
VKPPARLVVDRNTSEVTMRHDPLQVAIAERARKLWEGEGRPEGRALDHWLTAEREARADTETAVGGLRVPVFCADDDAELGADEGSDRR